MITTRNILTKSNLLDVISTYQIFQAYCRNFKKISQPFKSEFRDEKSPSCMIEHIGGDLLYTDFGEGSYRAIEYVMRKFNLDFRDAIRKINLDFGLNLIDNSDRDFKYVRTVISKINQTPHFKEKTTTLIEVSYAPYEDYDLEYWRQYGWTEEMLQRASIRPIDYFWLTMEHKGLVRMPYAVPHELAYTYDYYRHNGIYRRKLYFPEREGKYKWISNVDNTVIQNWDLLPKCGGDTLYITSSKKDCGPFIRIYNAWNSIAANSESSFILDKIFYLKIKPRWKRIIYFGDNDEAGIRYAIKWSKKYQIEAVWNPLTAPKDPAALAAKDGLREFNYQLQKLINNDQNQKT